MAASTPPATTPSPAWATAITRACARCCELNCARARGKAAGSPRHSAFLPPAQPRLSCAANTRQGRTHANHDRRDRRLGRLPDRRAGRRTLGHGQDPLGHARRTRFWSAGWTGCRWPFCPATGAAMCIRPSSVPYRANIDALKRLGCTDVVAVSACGSCARIMAPGDFVIVDQYHRPHLRAREVLLRPRLRGPCQPRPPDLPPSGRGLRDGGGAAGVQRPSAAAPISRWKARSSRPSPKAGFTAVWGADVIGMTGMPEAKLAREAELCYACVAMVTDYDCWHETMARSMCRTVIATLTANAGQAARA